MLNVKQVRQLIIRPSLEPLGLWSQLVENLIVGTGLQESGFHWLAQENGPALGPYQTEAKTYEWIRQKMYDHELHGKIVTVCNLAFLPTDPRILCWHLRYATIVCRFRYLLAKEPLPETINLDKIAQYWKTHYNTPEGAGTVEQFINNYNRYNQN